VAMTVTATQGGSPFAGMGLRVLVLTGAKAVASQTSTGHNHAEGANPNRVAITTTTAGSLVYAAIQQESAGAWTPNTGNSAGSQFDDTTQGESYGYVRSTSATGTPGSFTAGLSSTSSGFQNVAAAEILANGTIAEDASGPAFVSTSTLTALTTASFTPPSGSLLVALIGADGAADGVHTTTMAMTDSSSLTWTPLAQSASPATCYSGIFIADAPGAAAAVLPPRVLNRQQAVKFASLY
jgi:hypothetical protein